jgi:hypothetical protein
MHAESWAVPLLEQLIRRKQEQRAGLERFWQCTRWLRFLTLPAFPVWLFLYAQMHYAVSYFTGLRNRYLQNGLTRIDRFVLECLWFQSLMPKYASLWERIWLYYLVVFAVVFSLICYFMAFTAIYAVLR